MEKLSADSPGSSGAPTAHLRALADYVRTLKNTNSNRSDANSVARLSPAFHSFASYLSGQLRPGCEANEMAFPNSSDDNGYDLDIVGSPEYQIPPPQLTLLQRLLFRNPDNYSNNVKAMLDTAAAGMGRQPTQDEVNVLSQLAYKEAATAAWTVPVTVALAGFLTWQTRGTYRFPFWQPKFIKFTPDAFPSASRPLLQGRLANRAWHNTRFTAYFLLTSLGIAPFVASYATSVAMASAARDERLNQFRKDMKPERLVQMTADKMPATALKRQRQRTAEAISQLEKSLAALPQSDEKIRETTPLIQKRIDEYRKILAHIDAILERRGEGSAGDDGSAQNRDYETLSASSSTGGYSLPSESNYSSPTSYSRDPPSSEGRSGWGSGQQSSPQRSSSRSSDDLDYDDASPLSPAARAQSSSPSSTGSAWDRLRQASRQPPRASGNANQSQQEEAKGADYYAYDAAEKERNAEKDKAQAEFDAMLERERRGNAGQGSERNSRW
ncbi:hypothetical protein CPAR01_13036 [Colletotrichum paranaense]|uniref:Uncharacterized protein n=1 Tax=Colletotrichum paranaense TaxID=1914294 RepID=A0ABQ9S5X2_9PEZI|nr:uncharacterized protein CPAR01_13036 [Colletotrichum paranaense]KAK1526508.1 hypothetical protein CPAR01_13036 [Colletotrichum paranaense]